MRVFRSLRAAGLLAAAGACLTAAAAGGVAHARTDVAINGKATPAITGFPLRPRNVALTIEGRVVGDDVDGRFPATSTKIVMEFTHGARVNGAFFPSCNPKRLIRARGSPRACPRRSRIGGGYAFGTAISVTARLRMDVYNGPRGKWMLFYFSANNPVLIRQMIRAPFRQLRRGRYGFRIILPVPPGLQELSPGLVTSLRQFRTKVGGMVHTKRVRGRVVKRPFIEALTCPPGALVTMRGMFSFRNAPTRVVDSYIGCGSALPFSPEFPPSVPGSS